MSFIFNINFYELPMNFIKNIIHESISGQFAIIRVKEE